MYQHDKNNYENTGAIREQLMDAGKYIAFAASFVGIMYFAQLAPRWEAEKRENTIEHQMQLDPGCPTSDELESIESLVK